ncbi:MAG: hypothetical protein R3D70_02515 [Rhizobiaceae bacterium]
MIESSLFFSLGFLCASFLALMVAPSIWRRAVNLTRRRIEASVPLTLNEIQADKDKLRAEFAMSTHRLEKSLKGFKEKVNQQAGEIARNRTDLKRLTDDCDRQRTVIDELEDDNIALRDKLQQREADVKQLQADFEKTKKSLDTRSADLERLSGLYEELTLTASSRQIELVSRESEIEKLSEEVDRLGRYKRNTTHRVSELDNERNKAAEILSVEKSRASDLEGRIERMISTIADREEKLERREMEIIRLKEHLAQMTASENALSEKLMRMDAERVALEAQVTEFHNRMSALSSAAKVGSAKSAVVEIDEDRGKLEARLALMTRENKRLRAELSALENVGSHDASNEQRASALLREQINDLAAEVVNMTIMLEGKDSEVARTLMQKAPTDRPRDSKGREILSLSDRVRALQVASASRP